MAKPFRNITGVNQAGDEFDYKDLVKKSATSEDIGDTIAATSTTVIYSSYSFPLTTKGDILGHDGAAVLRKAVGANKTALVADSSTTDGLAWRTLNTTKGDLLGYDTDLKRVPIGTNDQVLMADSAQALGLKWATLTSAKGDILSHDGSDPLKIAVGSNGKALVADSTQTTGLSWSYIGGLAGLWVYGDGFDGDLTLSDNTTLGAGDYFKAYDNLDGAGFTLTYTASDACCFIHVKNTLENITISSIGVSASAPGTAGTSAACGGIGGVGGDGSGACWVYARICDTVLVTSAGQDGFDGVDAGAVVASAAGGNGASYTSIPASSYGGQTNSTNAPGVGIGGTTTGGGGTGGIAGVYAGAAQIAAANKFAKSLFTILFSGSNLILNAAGDQYRFFTQAGTCGGGGAGSNTVGTSPTGGGGGGGGLGLYTSGSAGAQAGVAALAVPHGSGGGGGGGAGGALAVLCCDETSGTVTCRAKGGDGGDGGDGSTGDRGNGGAGGGAGGGGIAVGIGPGVTVDAAAAIGGSGGATNGGGDSGDAASNGNAGRGWDMARV